MKHILNTIGVNRMVRKFWLLLVTAAVVLLLLTAMISRRSTHTPLRLQKQELKNQGLNEGEEERLQQLQQRIQQLEQEKIELQKKLKTEQQHQRMHQQQQKQQQEAQQKKQQQQQEAQQKQQQQQGDQQKQQQQQEDQQKQQQQQGKQQLKQKEEQQEQEQQQPRQQEQEQKQNSQEHQKRHWPLTFRFKDGLITVNQESLLPNQHSLSRMEVSELEMVYERTVLTVTADCSTTRRFGRRDDGGWDLCLVGPYVPQKPCFSFSFGINNIWEFDDEVADEFKCTVLTFDPSMKVENHNRTSRVFFFREGIHSSRKVIHDWPLDSYAGFLRRFGAQNFVIDILKMDVEGAEWPALQTAVQDASLNNVKQLLIETHLPARKSKEKLLEYLQLLRQLHNLGFRQWHHNWNNYGHYHSSMNGVEMTCCHELYFININFLLHKTRIRNSQSVNIQNPLSLAAADALILPVKYDRNSAVERGIQGIVSHDLTSLSRSQQEEFFFRLIQQKQLDCHGDRRIVESNSGDWHLCFSDPFNISHASSCTVVSFSAANTTKTFENILTDKYKCNVHFFITGGSDEMRIDGQADGRQTQLSKKVVTHNNWNVGKLCNAFNEMNHKKRRVDILKIHVTFAEWNSLEKAVDDGCLTQVKQLVLVTELRQTTEFTSALRFWSGLLVRGFRVWKWRSSPQAVEYKSDVTGKIRKSYYEHYTVNINFL